MRKTVIATILLFTVTGGIPAGAQRRGAGGASVTFAVAVSDPSGRPISDVKVMVTGAAHPIGDPFELPSGDFRIVVVDMHGTITEPQVTNPSRVNSSNATFAPWHMPTSSR